MPRLLPLRPQKVVLLKAFFVQLQVYCLVLQGLRYNYLAVLIVRETLMHGPPPAMVLEYLDDERRVVAATYIALVELE